MIEFLKGKLDFVNESSIVIDVNNIGYELFVTATVLGKLPGIGGDIKLYTYLQVKEDGVSLFGFATREELLFFKQLITVNGIGPKGALSILSFMSVEDLRFAILSEDSKTISKAPGIGAKTAGKLIIELRDKVKNYEPMAARGIGEGDSTVSTNFGLRDTAVQALVALGYSATEAMKAVNSVNVSDGMTDGELIRQSLKKIRS